jgi:hypothetical protein
MVDLRRSTVDHFYLSWLIGWGRETPDFRQKVKLLRV